MEISSLDDVRWLEAWREVPGGEVYFHPGYARVGGRWEGGTPGCLQVRHGGGRMLYVYLRHPIEDPHPNPLPHVAGEGEESAAGQDRPRHNEVWDAQTPYGYGGPAFVGEWEDSRRAEAMGLVAEYFAGRGTVAEFVRLHPHWCDPGMLKAAGYKVFQVRTNVECDLAGDFSAGWADSARRNLRKAMASGLRYRVGESDQDWESFADLYGRTADRLKMLDSYRFDHEYFAGLRAVPPVRLVLVEREGVALAGAIVFLSDRLAHYHLGGSDFAHQEQRPNDMLYFAMAETARAAGCQRIVWGGGTSNDPDDSLLRFKSHFGTIRRPVYCAGRILDERRFAAFCEAWQERNPGKVSKMFLKYRG